MRDLLTFAVYVLAYGALGSALSLSATLWVKRREQKLLKTFFFIAYLSLLFFLSGLRYALTLFVGWDGPGVVITFEILKRIAFASLIYFLPATMNYILGRRWTSSRIARVIVAALIYLSSGVASLFASSSPVTGVLAVLAFLLIVLFVLADAARGLPLVRDEATRVSLFLLYGFTFVFLPLAQIVPLIFEGYDRLLFITASVYHLMIAACADVYFYRALISPHNDPGEIDDSKFTESCVAIGLTKREIEIAVLIATGATYKEIAAELDISPNTVSNHVGTIYRKTGTRSKVEMVNALRDYQL